MEEAAPPSRTYLGILIILVTGLSLSSGSVYVRRGSDITDCSMKCLNGEGVLQLYRVCGDDESRLLELWCDNMWHYIHYQPRLHLNTSSGCWTLTDAGRNDSCLYTVMYHGSTRTLKHSIDVTVVDPVLISTITSNFSRLGQDIAVSLQFSGEEATVTWEVDGGSLPDRYRLIDDNRTMIIPRAQIDDAGRRLHVHIKNPVSEETREYQLEITGFSRLPVYLGIIVGIFPVIFLVLLVLYLARRRSQRMCRAYIISAETDCLVDKEETKTEKKLLNVIHKI